MSVSVFVFVSEKVEPVCAVKSDLYVCVSVVVFIFLFADGLVFVF